MSSPQGSDLTYQWTAPATGSYLFTTQANDFNTILYIYDSKGELRGCNPDSSSALVLDLEAHAAFRIIVDEASPTPNAQSTFTLNICSPVLCNTPPGSAQCFNAGTCAFDGACDYSPKGAGTGCDDQSPCTSGDVCNASGACAGTFACTAPPNARAVCLATGCGLECQPDYIRCGEACVSINDPNNCGRCGNTCSNPPDQCLQGRCSNGGCIYEPKPKGTGCDDHLSCTTKDVCNGAGDCLGTAIPCSDPPTACHQGACNLSTGQCDYTLKPAGSPCNDGSNSTTNDRCDSAGNCRGDTVCTQDGTRCWNSTTRAVCRNGILVPQSCGSDEQCVNNSCRQAACPPGSKRCANGECCAGVCCGKYSCCEGGDKCCSVSDNPYCYSRGESCRPGPVP